MFVQNDDGYSSHDYKRGPREKIGVVSDTENISASSSTIPTKRFNDNYVYNREQRSKDPRLKDTRKSNSTIHPKQEFRGGPTSYQRDSPPRKDFEFNNNDESSCYFDYDYLSNSSEDVVQPAKMPNRFENKKNSMVTFNTKIHKKGKVKESILPNLKFDSESDREELINNEDEYIYPDDNVKLLKKRNKTKLAL